MSGDFCYDGVFVQMKLYDLIDDSPDGTVGKSVANVNNLPNVLSSWLLYYLLCTVLHNTY
jgi:hypothetical protein